MYIPASDCCQALSNLKREICSAFVSIKEGSHMPSVNDCAFSVQYELSFFGLEIKVSDAYRPQRAVDNFVRRAAHVNDTKAKAQYHPAVAKQDLSGADRSDATA
jgi:hypothetical protein